MDSFSWTCTRQKDFRNLPENSDGHPAMKCSGQNNERHCKMSCICTISCLPVNRKIWSWGKIFHKNVALIDSNWLQNFEYFSTFYQYLRCSNVLSLLSAYKAWNDGRSFWKRWTYLSMQFILGVVFIAVQCNEWQQKHKLHQMGQQICEIKLILSSFIYVITLIHC